MRVAFLSHKGLIGDAIGGQLRAKVLYFLDRGADVRVFLESTAGLHPDLAPLASLVLEVETTGPVWNYLTECDLVFAEYPHWYYLLDFLPLLAGVRPRIVVEYHGVTPVELGNEQQRDVLRNGLRQRGVVWCADAVLVHSRFIARELETATGYPLAHMTRVPCVITERPQERSLPPPPPPGNIVLLFVGRLAANKRVPVLVQALARLRPDIHALIIGDDGDVYRETAQHCHRLADELGVGSRLHFQGKVDEATLAAAYARADVFVMPSLHEGFCLPVAEAMAAGLPVIGARAAALPETIGPAGLTFAPDDAADLARQVRRVVDVVATPSQQPYRVGIVAFRFGTEIVGGAETSLRTLALALQAGGHRVTIFTTCTTGESIWKDDLPAGVCHEQGLEIRRFPLDPRDHAAHCESVRTILEAHGPIDDADEENYLRHSIHSTALLDALGREIGSLDAVIAGPYLFGLTWDVARAFPRKTLLVPCFHDEPLAHLRVWHDYTAVAGMLYHSPEEQDFAQATLGLNHPHAVEIGTCIDMTVATPAPPGERYLVYCGRYSPHKNVPLLLEFLDRYQRERPGRFACWFLGAGDISLPAKPWLRDLGHVNEEAKRRLLAGAEALLQLSVNESLSLVALEAWVQGTPVIAHADCAVLAGQIDRAKGGITVDDYDAFAHALDDLWSQPESWKTRGQSGQAYVRRRYGSRQDYLSRLTAAIAGLSIPLRQHMQERGRSWSSRCQPGPWREAFGAFVETVLDAPTPTIKRRLEIHLHRPEQTVSTSARQHFLALRLTNSGNQPAMSDGPGRTTLHWQLHDHHGTSPLPCLILPGETRPASLTLDLPRNEDKLLVHLWATFDGGELPGSRTSLTLQRSSAASTASPLMEDVTRALAEAQRWQTLPDKYVDVTEGWFARWKRWCKRKLLGNFKHAYVDVLSRQQSHVNANLVVLCQSLAEHNAALEQALERVQERLANLEAKGDPAATVGDSAKETGLFLDDRLQSKT